MASSKPPVPLRRKLGLAPGQRFRLLAAPPGFRERLEPLPDHARLLERTVGRLDLVVLFARSSAELRRRVPGIARRLPPTGMLWIAWPKMTSGIVTDLAFGCVQRAGLDAGLVDNKVCAIDETWSALRFVIRRRDREP